MATFNQSDVLATVASYEQTGSISATARELGIQRVTVRNRLQYAKTQGIATPEQQIATLHGVNPEFDLTHAVPAPLVLKGTSTLYGADGQPKLQWVKTRLDQEQVEVAMRAAIEAMAESIPRVEPTAGPEYGNEKLCNCYVITDFHLGSLSWKEETGADWDLAVWPGCADHHIPRGVRRGERNLLNFRKQHHSISALTPICFRTATPAALRLDSITASTSLISRL